MKTPQRTGPSIARKAALAAQLSERKRLRLISRVGTPLAAVLRAEFEAARYRRIAAEALLSDPVSRAEDRLARAKATLGLRLSR